MASVSRQTPGSLSEFDYVSEAQISRSSFFKSQLQSKTARKRKKHADLTEIAAEASKPRNDLHPKLPMESRPIASLKAAKRRVRKTAPALLARDVEIYSDGGGKVIAFRNVVRGIDRALRLFAGLRRKQTSVPTLLRTATVDGLPGYVGIDRDDVLQTTALDVRDGRIVAIYIVRNPDKLRRLSAPFETTGLSHPGCCRSWIGRELPQ